MKQCKRMGIQLLVLNEGIDDNIHFDTLHFFIAA